MPRPFAYFIRSILLLVLITSLAGCSAAREKFFRMMLEPDPPSVPEGVTVLRDIQFAETPQGPLYLDIYLPKNHGDEPLPVIIFYFGGGWEMGNRHQLGMYKLEEFPRYGYAVIPIDYRLSDTATFPAQIRDAQGAVRWVRENSDKYPLDPDRIGVVGPSAGGHLAALVGTSGEYDFDINSDTSSAVQAVVNFFGPTDFLQANAHRMEGADDWEAPDSSVSRLLGAPIREYPELVAHANPITYIQGDEPPFLIIHGKVDEIVPLHQSEILQEALTKAGVTSELMVIEDGNHGWGGDFFSDKPMEATRAFFDRYLKPTAVENTDS